MALFTERELKLTGIESEIAKSATGKIKRAKDILSEEFEKYSSSKTYDIFLSHAFLDALIIVGLRSIFISMGYSVYVDWIEDGQLDRSRITKRTAGLLRERMNNCRSLFFSFSESASDSKWMPWELGYFDGIKGRVAILPVLESNERTVEFNGQEYLGLYPYVVKTRLSSSRDALWIHDSADKYTSFEKWLEGPNPFIGVF